MRFGRYEGSPLWLLCVVRASDRYKGVLVAFLFFPWLGFLGRKGKSPFVRLSPKGMGVEFEKRALESTYEDSKCSAKMF